MNKIGITGSKGFIGSLFCKKDSDLDCYAGEIGEGFSLKQGSTHVIHLAGANQYSSRNLKAANEDVLKYVIDQVLEKNSVLIFPSTCGLYGFNSSPTAFKEEDVNPLKKLNSYQLSKLNSEELIKNSGCKYIILRVFNVYGAGQKNNFIIPDMLEAARAKNSFRLNKPNRGLDFIHVEDLYNIIMLFIERNITNEVVNVGSGRQTALRDLGHMILGEGISYESNSEADYNFSDNKKLFSLIGNYQFKNLEQSLEELK